MFMFMFMLSQKLFPTKKFLSSSKVFTACAALALTFLSFACSNKNSSENLASLEESQSLYAIGQMMARKSDYLRLSPKEVEFVVQGFKDWSLRHTSAINYEGKLQVMQKFIDQRAEVQVVEQKKKGEEYLAKFIKAGGIRTGSGLVYKIVKAGSVKKPKPTDWVEVHYQGALVSGEVFDSSIDRKEKAQLPLDHVIRGWTEGLQLIGEGGDIELVVPPELAYGDQGSIPAVPGGATLVFKIQLFNVLARKS